MIESALAGLLAASVVFLPRYLFFRFPIINWISPVFILGIGAFAMLLQRFLLKAKEGSSNYTGLVDLLVPIYSPYSANSSLLWGVRSLISFFLSVFGGVVGPEGAAVELLQAIRTKMRARTARWFEERRRTDAAVSLSAAIAASFGTPFSAMLLPMELGMGGRALLPVVSSLVSFLSFRFLTVQFGLDSFDVNGVLMDFHFSHYQEWLGILLIGLICGGVGVVTIYFVRYTEDSLFNIFRTQAWMRALVGAVLLAAIFMIYKPFHQSSWKVLEEVLWIKHTRSELALYFCTQLLSLAVVLAGFGSVGVFWPIFALGGYLGFCVNHWALSGAGDFSAAAGLAGSAAFLTAILNTPLTGAVLAFELTQNVNILLPCLLAGFVAQMIRKTLRVLPLHEMDLQARGISLVQGRSREVLASIRVKDAMVTDYEIVHEQELVADLQNRIVNSKYPFLPVVNAQGLYRGLLTVDAIQEGWTPTGDRQAIVSLSKLLEAKDILYKSRFKSPFVLANDPLSEAVKVFDEVPCVPVLGDDRRVQGLLFAHAVRLAYDREVIRRPSGFQKQLS